MFPYLIQKFDAEYKKICEEHELHYSPPLLLTLLSTSRKPKNFLFYIVNNSFINKLMKEFIIKIYCKASFLNQCLLRFINRWRFKRLPSCNTLDLSFSPFGTNRIELIICSKKYTFQSHEFRHLIQSSLLHTENYMIVDPVQIKNPYTGIPFSKNTLYLIYLQLKHVHPLFFYYMKSNFELRKFLINYEGLLRTHLIEKTIIEYSEKKLKSICTKMLEEMTTFNFITGNYDRIVTIDKIKPNMYKQLILKYYNSLFSLNPYQREMEYESLVSQLIRLRDSIETSCFIFFI
jgi:hypothetical protein